MSTAHDFPLSPRVQEGLRLVQAGRFSKKEKWGEDLSFLGGSSVNLPLVKRKALAIEKVLSEMPVLIRRHELLVSSAVQTLLLNMAALPEYATQEGVEMAAKRLTSPYSVWGHSTPSYPRLLELGFDGRPIFSTLKWVSQAMFTSGRRKPRRRSDMALKIGSQISLWCRSRKSVLRNADSNRQSVW